MTDPQKPTSPLSTRECAEFMGVTTDYIVAAIKDGALRAEAFRPEGVRKTLYRIQEADFVAWLKAGGWKRLPKTGTDSR